MINEWTHEEIWDMLEEKVSGMKQVEAAALIGISPSSLSQILARKVKPSRKCARWVLGFRVRMAEKFVFRRM